MRAVPHRARDAWHRATRSYTPGPTSSRSSRWRATAVGNAVRPSLMRHQRCPAGIMCTTLLDRQSTSTAKCATRSATYTANACWSTACGEAGSPRISGVWVARCVLTYLPGGIRLFPVLSARLHCVDRVLLRTMPPMASGRSRLKVTRVSLASIVALSCQNDDICALMDSLQLQGHP